MRIALAGLNFVLQILPYLLPTSPEIRCFLRSFLSCRGFIFCWRARRVWCQCWSSCLVRFIESKVILLKSKGVEISAFLLCLKHIESRILFLWIRICFILLTIVSVCQPMHCINYPELLGKIAEWVSLRHRICWIRKHRNSSNLNCIILMILHLWQIAGGECHFFHWDKCFSIHLQSQSSKSDNF